MNDIIETKLMKADSQGMEYAARLLRDGEIAAVPTETVYGLAANALDTKAVGRIFAAKGRPQDNPLILHISDTDMLYGIAQGVSKLALELGRLYWPGPLTMIFERKDCVPARTCGGLDTCAVRMPDNAFTRELISVCGFPLAAPSANTSGLPSPTSAAHVLADMNGKIPLIIDGGECRVGVESTVICFESDRAVRILRPGAVTAEMLGKHCTVSIDGGVYKSLAPDVKAASPGMKYKHYSPAAQVYILDGATERVETFIKAHCNERTGFLGFGDENTGGSENTVILPYGKSPGEQAENLFSSLRLADEKGCRTVYVRMPEKSGIGLAVYNRLLRAAAFRIITL